MVILREIARVEEVLQSILSTLHSPRSEMISSAMDPLILVSFSRTNSKVALGGGAVVVVEPFPFDGVGLVSVLILGKDSRCARE